MRREGPAGSILDRPPHSPTYSSADAPYSQLSPLVPAPQEPLTMHLTASLAYESPWPTAGKLGEGTGMSLSMASSVLSLSGGLEVQSSLGA